MRPITHLTALENGQEWARDPTISLRMLSAEHIVSEELTDLEGSAGQKMKQQKDKFPLNKET